MELNQVYERKCKYSCALISAFLVLGVALQISGLYMAKHAEKINLETIDKLRVTNGKFP